MVNAMADIRRDLLEEQFSDAALLLLMDDYAEAEGSALWDVYLESDAEIPENLDRACQEKIQIHYKETEKSALLRRTVYRAAKIAAVFAVCIFLSVQLVMSVEAFRIPVLNYVIRNHPHAIGYFFRQESAENRQGMKDLLNQMRSIPPEGYELVKEYSTDHDAELDHNSILSVFFRNSSGNSVALTTYPASGTIMHDTKDAQVQETTINGLDATYLLHKDGTQTMLWMDPNQSRMYEVNASEMDETSFLRYVYQMAAIFQGIDLS